MRVHVDLPEEFKALQILAKLSDPETPSLSRLIRVLMAEWLRERGGIDYLKKQYSLTRCCLEYEEKTFMDEFVSKTGTPAPITKYKHIENALAATLKCRENEQKPSLTRSPTTPPDSR